MSEKKRVLGSDLEKIDAHIITSEEYEEIPELTDEFFERADEHRGGKLVRRGRPKATSRKLLLSVRYSPEVVEYFRATGEGWQVRMDEALKEWIKAHPRT
ncbi:BrnA antitoxin family protein [Methylocaldum sp.]|uniref:BrnA antitoxin family protein n=1 Tax=Methylocaldum sp. TaxID=1969727 RepID=UPI002D3EBD58|nr:BrnA antitoxin family protein [Methylocaldum sp.]HYE36770.1 BrnA antitoxin family protein [Methylocaldum sp.]